MQTDDFYCRAYCLLNMFRATLYPSSGAREYYTGDCCLWYLVLWFSSCRNGVEPRVMCPVCKPDGRTDRYDEANSVCSQYCKRAQKFSLYRTVNTAPLHYKNSLLTVVREIIALGLRIIRSV